MTSTSFERIGVVGAGAWGTALANVAARSKHRVTLYDSDPAVMTEIATSRTNARLLGVAVHDKIIVARSLKEAAAADVLLLVVPTQALRAAADALAPHIASDAPVIACVKGIERGSGKFATEIVAERMARARPAILSGPSFATDVATGLPTAVTLATADEALATALAETLSSQSFRVYHSTDVRGVEIGGAAKNVLAIAAGIVVGRGLGASAQAALITRGFAELMRCGRALGARPETLTGLSGLGDLVLTCSSTQSRNFAFGFALGRDEKRAAGDGPLVEGAFTASALIELARKKSVEMPICEAVDAVLASRLSVDEAIARLLARPRKAEV
jgi:glycerol-3-phosphate dehydrogenase (NAD(P)+)